MTTVPSPPLAEHGSGSLKAAAPDPKKSRRLSAGIASGSILVPRRKNSDSDATEDVDSDEKGTTPGEKSSGKKRSVTSSPNIHGHTLSGVLLLPQGKEDSIKKKAAKSHSASCGDVGALVSATKEEAKKGLDGSQISPPLDIGSSGATSKKSNDSRKDSFDKKEMKRRGSVPYMQSKFDLPREEVEDLIRGKSSASFAILLLRVLIVIHCICATTAEFRSVLHKKVIHHGVMYVYPNYILWLSNSRSTKVRDEPYFPRSIPFFSRF